MVYSEKRFREDSRRRNYIPPEEKCGRKAENGRTDVCLLD